MIGKTLGHYQITSQLGKGGMGEVYRAKDLKLGRDVAIKVLSRERIADPEAKQRFVREAQAASALNHPNIVTIYEIASENGSDFIAMEYVRGKTLGHLIGKRGLKCDVMLNYAVQLADALAAAHAIGVIHRDLKPSNVMVVEGQGLIKVLDFGLAKLSGADDGSNLTSTQTTQSIPEPKTAEGQILGTVAYMSPEQVEGKKVDARSDIFSFGAVLYEMLAGRPAFQGNSKISILAAVLREEPRPLYEVARGVPRELEELIGLCLRKDRDQRIQHMDDLRLLLQHLKQQPGAKGLIAKRPSHQTTRYASILTALAALLVLTAAGLWKLTHSDTSTGTATLTRLTWNSGLTENPVLSPDGKLLAYASDRYGEGNLDIWMQQLSGGEPVRLTNNPADDYTPSFSPDGSKIAFRSDRDNGGIYVISALGGQERLIARSGHNPRFSPDGTRIAYWVGEPANFSSSGKVYIVSAAGGKPIECQPGFADARYPIWTPDGKYLLFQGLDLPSGKSDWWVVLVGQNGSFQQAIKTGAFEIFQREGLSVNMGPGGFMADRILFSANAGSTSSIYQIHISTKNWKAEEKPQRLTFGTGLEAEPFPGPGGQLVFFSMAVSYNIWFLPINSLGQPGTDIQPLSQGRIYDATPSCSRDGRKVVFASGISGNRDVWLKDFQTGRETPLTAAPGNAISPIISADGVKVAYSLSNVPTQPIYIINLSLPPDSRMAEKVCDNCGKPVGWSPDGDQILYVHGQPKSIGLFNVALSQKIQLLRHARYDLDQAQFSPDGAWISVVAYTGPDYTMVYVLPFRDGAAATEDQWIPITSGESWDDRPRWSPDGTLMYYYSKRDGYGCIWKQALDRNTKRPIGAPSAVHHFHSSRLSLMHMQLNGIGISVALDKLIFNLVEITGNVWMMQGSQRLSTQ